MDFHEVERSAEAVFLQYRIRVEQEHKFAARCGNALVIGFGEACVFAVGDQFHLGELPLQHGQAVVFAVVIDYNDLCVQAACSAFHAQQALLEEVAHIVIDDDDADTGQGQIWYSVRWMMLRPRVISSVYSSSAPILTPREMAVMRTPLSRSFRPR